MHNDAGMRKWSSLPALELLIAVSTQSVSTAALHWVVENIVAAVGTGESSGHRCVEIWSDVIIYSMPPCGPFYMLDEMF